MSPTLPSPLLLAPFTARAASADSTPAVICGARSLSAAELEARSSALARRLIAQGVKHGDFIGIGLERSLELVVALLAVVKSGAAYIPLDPAYPEERLRHMMNSAGIRLTLSREGLRGIFEKAGAVTVMDATQVEDAGEIALPEEDPDVPLYAIFTSGSTGEPKAASVYSRGFANLLGWYSGEFQLGPEDCTLVISSPSFDLTQKNFFTPLRTGGTLVLDAGSTYDISRITELIRRHRVTLLNCTPSAFYPLMEAAASGGYADIASLRFVILGGEPISIPRLRPWLEHPACQAEVGNTYGPTECTDICAFYRLHRGNLNAYSFVPLGREIPNVAVSIRDEDGAPLTDGEIGELCISGAGVGGGYLGDPARTAERFIEDHTLYRSGDLARRLPDGVLEFRGRADHQVKVNGHRIELGEIEIALQRHAGVREAVALAADGRLTAFVQGDATAAELRTHLAAALPAYMIPGEFRNVETFPLTPNGKIDRLALGRVLEGKPNTAPAVDTGGIAGRILTIWSEALGKPVSDPDANFFDLGGTSIHLAVVHVKFRTIMERDDLAITELFARPTARALAAYLSPQETPTVASPAAQDRARMQQAGFARFKKPARP